MPLYDADLNFKISSNARLEYAD